MALPVMTIEGDVVAVHSFWTDDESRIVTEATVHTTDGNDMVVSQLGGSADGLGMVQFPGPAILQVGMRVSVGAHMGLDLEQSQHIVLDDVRVLSYPPNFVRTGKTDAGNYLFWESGCVFITPDSAGTTAIPGDGEFSVIGTSIQSWNSSTENATCSYLDFRLDAAKSSEVGNDKVNLIKFRDTHWGRPAVGKDAARDYDEHAAGLTTAVYINDGGPRDGAIVDADVELNGVNFDISTGCLDGQSSTCQSSHAPPASGSGINDYGAADLQNTLTHELGHVHGLEHTCLNTNDPPRTDNNGNAVPSCFGGVLPPAITDATMYPFQDAGETKKRSLSDDDIQAICSIYPVSKNPHTCAPVPGGSTGGCCSASDRRPEGAMLLAGMILLVLRRRRQGQTA